MDALLCSLSIFMINLIFHVKALILLMRSGVSAERRQSVKIEECGFLPKAATPASQEVPFVGIRPAERSGVAQICNLLYRRIAFGKSSAAPPAFALATASGLQIRDTAECNSALRRLRLCRVATWASQLRKSRLEQ